MEEINEEQQLKIVRKKTEVATTSIYVAIVATVYIGLLTFLEPDAGMMAIFGVLAIASALTALTFAMVRREVFAVALIAILLTVDTIAYFAWLLPLLPRG
ncbi:MAG: hypothetical protein WAV56_00565 [Microgenomates group bacterium]